MPLPVPRLSATITPPARRGDLGMVAIHVPGARVEPAPARAGRAWHRCSRCLSTGHNAKNKSCPARAESIEG